jgi:hypothetical protein
MNKDTKIQIAFVLLVIAFTTLLSISFSYFGSFVKYEAAIILVVSIILSSVIIGLISNANNAKEPFTLTSHKYKQYPKVVFYTGSIADFEKFYKDNRRSKKKLKESIIASSVMDRAGIIYCAMAPGRHHHVMALCFELNGKQTAEVKKQGFITSYGRYVDREEALDLAKLNGQFSQEDIHKAKLYSEDVWANSDLRLLKREDALRILLESETPASLTEIKTLRTMLQIYEYENFPS